MKKKQQYKLSNKKLFILVSLIVCVGIIMLASTIIYSQYSQQSQESQSVAQGDLSASKGGASASSSSKSASKGGASASSGAKITTGQGTGQSSAQSNAQASANASSSKSAANANAKSDFAKSSTTNSNSANSTSSNSAKSGASSNASSSSNASTSPNATESKPATNTSPSKGTKTGKIVIVFDDAGHNMAQLKPFLSLPFKATIAILPQLAHSKEAADAIRAAGVSAILHQPMQAVDLSISPGDGAIKPDMYAYEIEQVVLDNIEEVGPVVALNNHEGSLITANHSSIGTVLDVCKSKGIFFLDSRTNSESKAKPAALERGMNILERDIFLDNIQEKDEIVKMVNQGLSIADKKGYVIMIGHIWCNNLAQILTELYPSISQQGYTFVTLDELYKQLYK